MVVCQVQSGSIILNLVGGGQFPTFQSVSAMIGLLWCLFEVGGMLR